MATKKLEQEFVKLKKEFITLQDLIHDVVEKHSDLEKKYEKSISKKKKANLSVGSVVKSLKMSKDYKNTSRNIAKTKHLSVMSVNKNSKCKKNWSITRANTMLSMNVMSVKKCSGMKLFWKNT